MRLGQRINAAYEACKAVVRLKGSDSLMFLALGEHIDQIAAKHRLTRLEVQELMARAVSNTVETTTGSYTVRAKA